MVEAGDGASQELCRDGGGGPDADTPTPQVRLIVELHQEVTQLLHGMLDADT